MTHSNTSASQKRAEYDKLLKNLQNEQEMQTFLEENTEFIPREFLLNHGIHDKLLFRKLPLGNDYITDFCYISKSTVRWNIILIEIEKPQSQFFKEGTNDFHSDFQKGLEQISKWKAWLESHKDSFTKECLKYITSSKMAQNPCEIKYILVSGRRKEYEGNNDRLARIREREQDDFRILNFDSLTQDIDQKTHHPLYLCVRKNEFLEIHSPHLHSERLDTNVFDLPLEQIRVTKTLKQDLIRYGEKEIENNKQSIMGVADKDKENLEKWKKLKEI